MEKNYEAKKVLGYVGELNLKKKLNVRIVQSAIDAGAYFPNKDRARRFARKERYDVVVILNIVFFILLIGMLFGAWTGWIEGFSHGLQVCQVALGVLG